MSEPERDEAKAALEALAREGEARKLAEKQRALSSAEREAWWTALTQVDHAGTALLGRSRELIWLVLGFFVTPALLGGLGGLLLDSADAGFGLFGAGMVLAIAPMFLLRPTLARRALVREKTWLLGLPFAVEGWLEVISAPPRDTKIIATLHFREAAPDKRTLEGLAALVGATANPGLARVALTSRELSVDGGDSDDHNGNLLAWQHALVKRVALPLHAAHPLVKLSLHRG